MVVEFVLDGQTVLALNGGPQFKFNEAISLNVECKDQAEVDRYWKALGADGGEEGPCGWLKDKFGLSWQVNPTILTEMLDDPDPKKAKRVMDAMMKMKKIGIPTPEEGLRRPPLGRVRPPLTPSPRPRGEGGGEGSASPRRGRGVGAGPTSSTPRASSPRACCKPSSTPTR